ncbi:SAM-dependent methyltransferase [Cohnella sp. CIP 111063]|jgi:Methylase involved in ubiquinone/menaquinone biosynthesis|uniref:class I SAM-dependent methyltransferase n=1 Tax=unclassified Cohnella TaxID=2636738 RepID=UPI000B8BD2D7|nr:MULTISPECIES: class I SAM-dependent methyltransferase [unclassified Cohnella]OXS56588.1 SAM-dependent methyltransferase [Cohnella sp. CIP 111063]PRX68771.1 methyltransferase family protein [Cohnella sp. SGD-V74]
METYWNHNSAFHEELVANAKARGGQVLDIGCGEGLLLQRLAPIAHQVVGIEPDPAALARAQKRLSSTPNATLINEDFLAMPVPSPEERYSTVTCVATLHHMELRAALSKMRQVLAPGGQLLVVGLAANKSIMDFVVSGLLVLPIRVMDRLHGGVQESGVRVAAPKDSLSEIRQAAREILPGAVIRRRFYYRYMISWQKPMTDR